MPATINISMPVDLKSYVDERVDQGKFKTPAAYIQALIQKDREHHERQQFEQRLLARLAAEDSRQLDDGDWQIIRQRLNAARQTRLS